MSKRLKPLIIISLQNQIVSISQDSFVEISIQQKGVCGSCQRTHIPKYYRGFNAYLLSENLWILCDGCVSKIETISEELATYKATLKFCSQHLISKEANSNDNLLNPSLPEHLGF